MKNSIKAIDEYGAGMFTGQAPEFNGKPLTETEQTQKAPPLDLPRIEWSNFNVLESVA